MTWSLDTKRGIIRKYREILSERFKRFTPEVKARILRSPFAFAFRYLLSCLYLRTSPFAGITDIMVEVNEYRYPRDRPLCLCLSCADVRVRARVAMSVVPRVAAH